MLHEASPYPDPGPSRDNPVERELEDFIYIVSHDMAASVRHVTEFSRLLINDLGDSLTPRQRSFAARVLTTGERSQEMLEQLLAFSRVQQKPLAPAPQDATHQMKIACLKLSSQIHVAHADVRLEPLGTVVADPDLLELVFHHLLDNAIKFSRPGVEPRVDVSVSETSRWWILRIADNGQGVPPEYREKAFRMFQLLHPEGVYPGQGVGLTLCRRIARRHGGDIRFIDQAAGACVEVTLPQAGSVS